MPAAPSLQPVLGGLCYAADLIATRKLRFARISRNEGVTSLSRSEFRKFVRVLATYVWLVHKLLGRMGRPARPTG